MNRTRGPGALRRAPLRPYNYWTLLRCVRTFADARSFLWREYSPHYTSVIEHPLEIDVLAIDDVPASVLDREGRIDILKIDTEGTEIPTVIAASADLLSRVGTIYLEASPHSAIRPDVFVQRQNGQVCVLRPAGSAQ